MDENGEDLGGAKIGLFVPSAKEFTEDTAILVTTSAEDGSFWFENVPYGLWIVLEISQPEVFVLEIVSLDAEGKGIAQTDLPLGSYYLKEHSTDAHYLLSGVIPRERPMKSKMKPARASIMRLIKATSRL